MCRFSPTGTTLRLQFRRWLTVEDGYFDQAIVEVNGTYYQYGERYANTTGLVSTWAAQDAPRFAYNTLTKFGEGAG